MKNERKLIVIGGGAAGFFCAVNAARLDPSLQVVILEKNARYLQKVKVSGGGRCNVTHACFEISHMVKRYPRGEKFLKKAFQHFFTKDTANWFEERGVTLKTEADGRMFPVTDDSQTIIDCLLEEANKYQVQVQPNSAIDSINFEDAKWSLKGKHSGREATWIADELCIASGGFAKEEQFNWIISGTGHSIEKPVPSLFTFNLPKHPICELMGVSVTRAQVKLTGSKLTTEGPLLVTHWGLSGPAILRMSAFAARELAANQYRYQFVVNWVPQFNENSLRERMQEHRFSKPTQKLTNTDWIDLPQRLWEFLLRQSDADPDTRWTDLAASHQNKLVKSLCGFAFAAEGKTTFKEEFATAGGIRLAEIDPNTMQSRLKPQLYFAGEVMDVDGITGGFNFQHAWTSAYIAAQAIAAKSGHG